MPFTTTEFAGRVREKYPGEYDHLDDQELTTRVVEKYPEYRNEVSDFAGPQAAREPQAQYTPEEFSGMVRKKYPGEYDHLSDRDLSWQVAEKYPEYKDKISNLRPDRSIPVSQDIEEAGPELLAALARGAQYAVGAVGSMIEAGADNIGRGPSGPTTRNRPIFCP